MPIIALRDVIKTYHLGRRDIPALRGISLTIDQPGFYGIMGTSGSGKSTLLHLMAGLDRPDSGDIDVAGQRIDRMPERALTLFRRRHIGIVFQQFNLIPTLSAVDNAALPGLLDGQPIAVVRRRATELLETLGMGHRLTHRPDALSGGEQQRVAIARALYFEPGDGIPGILFADEPTGNLDSTTSEQLFALLENIAAERQLTVLMVTHEPSAAIHCDRVFVLRDGRITGNFDVDGLDVSELATRTR